MKIFQTIILVILVLISLYAGVVTLLGLWLSGMFVQEARFAAFLLVALAVVQILGGILAVVPKFKLPGAILMMVGFVSSPIITFMTGWGPFNAFSLLLIVFAGLLIADARK